MEVTAAERKFNLERSDGDGDDAGAEAAAADWKAGTGGFERLKKCSLFSSSLL